MSEDLLINQVSIPQIEIQEAAVSQLCYLSSISIAYEVISILEINPTKHLQDNWTIKELQVGNPYVKDYDAISENHPLDWADQFDMTNWGLLYAFYGVERVGGALIAFNTPGVNMLEDRNNLAVLWDIRVAPEYRGKGVGKTLFKAVQQWAISKNCSELKIETQNNNVTAVRFYFKQGCTLKHVIKYAYPNLPDEVQLLFYKNLN